MQNSRFGRTMILVLTLLTGFTLLVSAVAADQGNSAGADSAQVTVASLKDAPIPVPEGAGDFGGTVIESFANSWHLSTIGLTYDPVDDSVWYAHEAQATDPNTIWNIDRPS